MAEKPTTLTIICAQCGNRACRAYRGSGVKPTLCGNACKIAAYRKRRPERAEDSRARERAKAGPRFCCCGAPLPARKRVCQDCRDATKAKAAYVPREDNERQCLTCYKPVIKWKRFCEDCIAERKVKNRKAAQSSPAGKLRRAKHRRVYKARRRALERGRDAERFDPLDILARDGWRCHICGVKTPKRLRGTYEDCAPELDHIVPLAAGGEHSRLNTACSCRKCNIEKADRPLGQMRLVA